MIFLWIGLGIVGVSAILLIIFLWVIPAIKNKSKNKKAKENEIHEKLNEVKLADKSILLDGVEAESVEYGKNREEYMASPAPHLEEESNVLKNTEEENDFKEFVKNLESRKESVQVENEIKNASPKLKALLFSGALNDRKFDL